MIFDEYMDALATRIKQPDAATSNVRFQSDIPYTIKSELEEALLMSLAQVLGEVEEPDWDSFGPEAMKVISGGANIGEWSVLQVPYTLRRVLAASVDGEPAVQASVEAFIQFAGSNVRYTSAYALMTNNDVPVVAFRGTSITLTILVEPARTEWKQMSKSILPPGYDLRVLDIAFKRWLISDYAPEWGA